MKRILTALIVTSMLCSSFAEEVERVYPHGCRQKGFAFDNDELVLSRIDGGQQETLYLVHNNSPYEIVLETEVKSKYIPSFKKTLPAQHWAAFSRLDKQIRFDCRLSPQYHGYREILNCHDMLQICNYNRAKFPTQNLGTYWLQKTSLTQKTVMEFVIDKGILLRW